MVAETILPLMKVENINGDTDRLVVWLWRNERGTQSLTERQKWRRGL